MPELSLRRFGPQAPLKFIYAEGAGGHAVTVIVKSPPPSTVPDGERLVIEAPVEPWIELCVSLQPFSVPKAISATAHAVKNRFILTPSPADNRIAPH